MLMVALAVAAAAVRADATTAIAALEARTASGHDAQVEIALVRARMQAGEYRHALSFAAHVNGEHPDIAAATVLYAWLLRLGGQRGVAERLMAEALARRPGDPLLREAAQALASPLPAATGVLLEPPHRLAPDASESPPIPPGARVLSSAVLIGGGALALAPAQLLRSVGAARLWVRNGLGEASPAEVDPSFVADPEVVVLRLSATIDANGADGEADRDPFAGSPGFAFAYPPTVQAAPAWPQLYAGFMGGIGAAGSGRRRLGIDVGEVATGGPVLDASGRLTGIILRDAAGAPLLRPVSTWPMVANAAPRPPVPPSSLAALSRVRPPSDVAYERGMRIALQLIVAH